MSLAGKIFPTVNKNEKIKTLNFVLAENIGGTDTSLFTKAEMLNQPGLDLKSYELLAHLSYVTEVFKQSNLSDEHSKERQVYSLAEFGLNKDQKAIVPKWMKIFAKNTARDKEDFREELNFEGPDNKGELIYEIYVANQETNKIKNWESIGSIVFTESALSKACDHRLHFNHDKWRDDLDHGI